MAQKRKAQKVINRLFGKKSGIVYAAIAVVIALIWLLSETGVVDFDKLKEKAGFSDAPAVDADMSVHFIDVGQGDSTLVVSNGEAMLVDAGERDCGQIVGDYLDEMGITKLKYVIGTHPHSDHIGGLSYIIENYEVETIIMPKVPDDLTPTTAVYENLLETISSKGMKIHQAKDELFTLGESEVMTFEPMGDYSNLNDYSVCVKITHGENSFLLTGDTENTAEKNFVMRCSGELDVKVLSLGHHGSNTASSTELLDASTPRYAVISCGADNKYGHPHQETVDRINKYADHVLRTDIDGTVIFESDGKGLNVINTSGKSLIE